MHSIVCCRTLFWIMSFQLYSPHLTCDWWWVFREIWWSACLYSSADCCSHSLHYFGNGWWVPGWFFWMHNGLSRCIIPFSYQPTVFFFWRLTPCLLFHVAVGTGISQLQFANMNLTRNIFVVGFSLFMGLSVPQYFTEFATRAGHGPVNTNARWVHRQFYFQHTLCLLRSQWLIIEFWVLKMFCIQSLHCVEVLWRVWMNNSSEVSRCAEMKLALS